MGLCKAPPSQACPVCSHPVTAPTLPHLGAYTFPLSIAKAWALRDPHGLVRTNTAFWVAARRSGHSKGSST